MFSRTVKLTLIALTTLWATGLSQFLHEKFDHEDNSAVVARVLERAQRDHQPQCYQDDDDHDCAICNMLATMTASQASLPVVVPSHELILVEQPVVPDRPLCRCTLRMPFARGPPALV